ncbi:hypothetical protein [Streptosporangium sandarakinum]|uniref:hypothetical protein n=1 Tax=Streptosporangium sandarakinum TaxID=1260955 RepID=UPI0037B310BE
MTLSSARGLCQCYLTIDRLERGACDGEVRHGNEVRPRRLSRPLAAAMGRAKRVEAAGAAVELAEVEQARQSVEEELEQAGAKGGPIGVAEADDLVGKATRLGWHLAMLGPGFPSDVVVNGSGEKPVVRSPVAEALHGGRHPRTAGPHLAVIGEVAAGEEQQPFRAGVGDIIQADRQALVDRRPRADRG